jgi:hypothetical protein
MPKKEFSLDELKKTSNLAAVEADEEDKIKVRIRTIILNHNFQEDLYSIYSRCSNIRWFLYKDNLGENMAKTYAFLFWSVPLEGQFEEI